MLPALSCNHLGLWILRVLSYWTNFQIFFEMFSGLVQIAQIVVQVNVVGAVATKKANTAHACSHVVSH